MKNDMKAAVSPMEMDVRIFPYRGDGPVAAIASVTLNGCFAVRDVRIMEGKNGLFVSMPSRKVKGEYRDICYPCTKDFKQQFDQKVLEAYEQAQVQEAQKAPNPEGHEEHGPPMAMEGGNVHETSNDPLRPGSDTDNGALPRSTGSGSWECGYCSSGMLPYFYQPQRGRHRTEKNL